MGRKLLYFRNKVPYRALALSTLVLLAGCSSMPSQIPVRELPSPELLRDCPHPSIRAETNGDLAWTIIEYRKALRLCNIDKKALREWAGEPASKPEVPSRPTGPR